MTSIIFLRGPSAVGKTAIAKNLLLNLKKVYKKDCAFISEDNFRKKMQFKYKAEDKKVHINSVLLIKRVIDNLLKIDKYNFIIIEGLLRYKEMIKSYKEFCNKNKFDFYLFQLTAPLEVRKERNRLSEVRDHISDLESSHGLGKGEEIPTKESIILDTTSSIDKCTRVILSKILGK